MKADNINRLVTILKGGDGWFSAATLGKMLNVDKRTVRNYINELNAAGKYSIESSPQGYRMQRKAPEPETDIPMDYLSERMNKALYYLLSNEDGMSVFDMAEAMGLSESTVLNNIIPKVKQYLRPYNLEVRSHDYVLCLTGSEKNKRRLIRHIALNSKGGFFLTNDVLRQLAANLNVEEINDTILRFCRESGLSVNNTYALNNLIIHIIVIFIRISKGDGLTVSDQVYNTEQILACSSQKDNIISFAEKIRGYCREVCGRDIAANDYEQILLLIALSTEQLDGRDVDVERFTAYVDKSFYNKVVELIGEMRQRYTFPEPSREFLCQFTLHVFNLYQRCIYRMNCTNPVAAQIKRDYAPVYDMAAYFAHRLSQTFDITVSEDEIGFIAFHFGALVENGAAAKDPRISFLLVLETYRSYSRALVHELHLAFADDLHLVDMIPVADYRESDYSDVEMIITTSEYNFRHPHTIVVNPIITKKNIRTIAAEIEKINRGKKYAPIIPFLRYMFSEALYFRDMSFDSPEDAIRFLGGKAQEHGFASQEFIDDVLEREAFSSTAFTDSVAVPHSISVCAKRSFICVLHNNKAMPWGKTSVNFVMLTGVAKDEMKYFQDVLHIMIDAFLDPACIADLLKAQSLDEFIDTLVSVR